MAKISDRIFRNISAAVGLLFLLGAVAQAAALQPRASTTSTSSATSTSTSIVTHTVSAGKDASFVFSPDSITANVGDIIGKLFNGSK